MSHMTEHTENPHHRRICKASGKHACARCGRPMQKGQEAVRREEGILHFECDDMLATPSAAKFLGISANKLRRLAKRLGIEPDATKKNPHYATGARMSLWFKSTLVERFLPHIADRRGMLDS